MLCFFLDPQTESVVLVYPSSKIVEYTCILLKGGAPFQREGSRNDSDTYRSATARAWPSGLKARSKGTLLYLPIRNVRTDVPAPTQGGAIALTR